MQWLSWWRSMSWIFYREIVKIGRDPRRWQCCMWQKWQAAQAERDGRRIWKLDRGLGQKTRSETALRKRQHEWQIDNTNDKAILNKQTHQSIHCFVLLICDSIHFDFTCSIGPHSHFHPFVYQFIKINSYQIFLLCFIIVVMAKSDP